MNELRYDEKMVPYRVPKKYQDRSKYMPRVNTPKSKRRKR